MHLKYLPLRFTADFRGGMLFFEENAKDLHTGENALSVKLRELRHQQSLWRISTRKVRHILRHTTWLLPTEFTLAGVSPSKACSDLFNKNRSGTSQPGTLLTHRVLRKA